MSEGRVMYTMMVDAELKGIALAKASKNNVSLAHIIRDYLAWWVNLEDLHPVVMDRSYFVKLEEK